MGMEILNKAADAAGYAMALTDDPTGIGDVVATRDRAPAVVLPEPGPWRPIARFAPSRAAAVVTAQPSGWSSGAWLRAAYSYVYGRAPA